MKKLLNWAINVCMIVSMIIPAGFSGKTFNSAKAASVPEVKSSGMFRTTIQLEQAYDLTRLNKLDVVVLAQDDMQVDLLVTELQLESLSRLGFEPAATSDLGLLVDANQDTYHWLKTAIQGKIDQASVLVEENRLTNEATTKVNDLEVLSLIKSLSIEQLAGIQTLPGVDNDADGLTDTQESWWCTDPNNVDTDADGRSDYAEIQALKDWMANRRAVAPGETPWASWPFNPVTCPDKDFDSIPNLAERWELGLNMDLESTDRDKFDDGQEVFGVTYCPGGDFSCGYGDLPRSSDAGYVGQVMPSWVKAPGNHPFVAAFPLPTVAIEQSSIHIETVTVITTDHIISTGTEAIYSTAKTKGTNTSLSNTITWNEWQESYESTEEIEGINGIEITDPWQCLPWEEHCYYKEMLLFNADVSAMEKGCNITSENKSTSWGGGASVPIPPLFMITPHGEFSKESGQSSSLSDEYTGPKCRAAIKKFCDKHQGDFNDDWQNFCELANIKTDAPYNPIDSNFVDESTNMNVATDPNNYSGAVSNYQLSFNNIGETIANQLFELQFAITAKRVITGNTDGESHGGAQTTTTEQVDLTTTTNGESFSSEEAWGSAVAVDSSHAADFWFSYTVMNNGTDYAREISNLSFNIFIGDDPLSTYYISSDIGGEGILRNFQPGESHTYTSQRIPISLEQMKQIDLGSAISIIVEDISFGSDEYFYQNIINSNLQLSIDDGIDDNDEIINHYSISVFNGDLLLDVILRYFLFSTDIEGDLTALWTPEYIDVLPEWCNEAEIVGSGSTRSVWCKHQLTLGDWWNVYSNELENEDIPFQDRVAIPGSAVLIRFNKDSDLDGYSDLSEKRLETDPSDPKDFPQQELLAGIHSLQNGNNVTSTLSLLSTGLYDVYGVEAVMIAPDDSVSIVKNTVGGSGRVKAGQGVVAGSRIFTPEYSELTWTGSAFPVSAGYFTGVADLTYNFTVSCDNPGGCFVGQDDWSLNWITDVSSGTVEFSSSYQSPTPIDVDTNGLQIIFISGDVFDGNTFIIDAHSPRDTFQYTINYEPYTEPIVLVSYNDPQGNHRFVIPSNSMSLTSPSDNLVDFRGTMLNFNGVEILSLSEFSIGTNTNKFILDNPTEKPINDGQIFIEFIDLTGEVVSEILYTGDFLPGPNIIEITWSTSDFYPVYDPDRAYVILAYWTDYEGNILDTSGRPLSSFQVDPQPEFVITPADETWYFGTTSQGTILKRDFSFANTGERTLLTYVDAPEGLLVSQTGRS